jgi:hypothetical protein
LAGGCGQFYAITIASEAFKGLSTVKQHRLVTETLKKEIEGIHGLQVQLPVRFWPSISLIVLADKNDTSIVSDTKLFSYIVVFLYHGTYRQMWSSLRILESSG